MGWKPVNLMEVDEQGNIILNLASTAADDDWMRAGRLARKAEAGDEEAAKELQRLRETPMVQFFEDEQDGDGQEADDAESQGTTTPAGYPDNRDLTSGIIQSSLEKTRMETIFSHIVQKRFSHLNEDIATEALAFMLQSSDNARKGIMQILQGVIPELPMLRFETQKSEKNIRPDMWGYDSAEPRVFIENKFWAGLTDSQPVAYLRQLSKYTQPTLLFFVVPDAREHIMWRELNRRLKDAGIMVIERNEPGRVSYACSTDMGPVLSLISWGRLLSGLALYLADEPLMKNNLTQLQALCEAAEIDAFVPISPQDLSNQVTPAFVLQLNTIVQASVEMAVAKRIFTTNGYKAQASWERIGRYVKFLFENGPGVWIGVHFGLWKKYGETPLWMVFAQTDWGRAIQSRPLIEAWAARKGIFVTFNNEELAIALNLACGEDKDQETRKMVNLYKDIADALCPGWE